MKIVSLSYNYSPEFTSSESWLKRTALYHGSLEDLAKQHEVIAVKQIGWHGLVKHNGVEHQFTNFGTNKFLFTYRINRLVKSLKPDILLLQGLHHPVAFIQLRYLLSKNTRVIAQHHAEKPSKTLKRYFQILADRYIDAYLFSSTALGEDWINAGIVSKADKIHEVMEVSSLFHPVEQNTALQKTGITGTPIFLWVGRLNQNKDPLNVVRGFLKFAETNPSAKLYMIYQTDELLSEVNDLLNNHANKASVVLVGKVANEDLLYWYNSANFFLSGSHYEGSGTAVCEAMSCGCIPIITDIASFRMITYNGDCGLLYEAGNIDALVNVLKQSQKLDLTSTRQKCLDWFEEKLSFKAIASDIESVAYSILK